MEAVPRVPVGAKWGTMASQGSTGTNEIPRIQETFVLAVLVDNKCCASEARQPAGQPDIAC